MTVERVYLASALLRLDVPTWKALGARPDIELLPDDYTYARLTLPTTSRYPYVDWRPLLDDRHRVGLSSVDPPSYGLPALCIDSARDAVLALLTWRQTTEVNELPVASLRPGEQVHWSRFMRSDGLNRWPDGRVGR